MDYNKLIITIIVMAIVSYLPRVLPIAIFRDKIKNKFIQSILIYMPYGILAAMVFPGVLYSTQSLIPAIFGAVASFIMAYKKWSLLPVAIGAVSVVFITERLIVLFS